MLKITLKDGSVRELAAPQTIADFTKDLSMGLYRNACCALVDGKVAVDRDGNQRLQPGVLVNFANADIGDVHACFSFRVLGFLFRPDGLTVSLGSGREKYAPIPTFCGKIPRTIVKTPADGV